MQPQMYKIFKMILSDKTGISNILFPFRGGGHCFSAHATPAPRTIPNAIPPTKPGRPTACLNIHRSPHNFASGGISNYNCKTRMC